VDGTGVVPAEALAVLAFQQIDRLAARARSILVPNLASVTAFLDGRAELEYVRPAGGTVIFPRFRDGSDTSLFADRLLAETGTAVVPGRFFESPSHMRISFGAKAEVLANGLAALASVLGQ
jgi:aspartate/methionine/tyrosine aminotransferase